MREKNKKIADDTLKIVEQGEVTVDGERFEFSRRVENAKKQTVLYKEEELQKLEIVTTAGTQNTIVAVTGNTTLVAAERLREKYEHVLVLNFASAKNPGGGFLKGSSAQEESIARSSTLYDSLKSVHGFYDYHAKKASPLYSSRTIYSPDVVVFKKDDGTVIKPYNVNVVTVAAVNAGDTKAKNNKEEVKRINSEMEERIYNTLNLAKKYKQEALVLGAFGCGVFKNDPNIVAELFRRILKKEEFQNVFKEIEFAIYEGRGETKMKRIFEIKMKRK